MTYLGYGLALNQNCFREIVDKFNVSVNTAHDWDICCDMGCDMAQDYIIWPSQREKETSAGVFKRITGLDNVIGTGAIDGCHIKI